MRHFGLFYGFTRYSDQGDLLWSVVFAAIDGTCEVVGDLKDASYAEGDAGTPPYRDVVCRGAEWGITGSIVKTRQLSHAESFDYLAGRTSLQATEYCSEKQLIERKRICLYSYAVIFLAAKLQNQIGFI